jgi:hypothetical protein
MEAAMTAVDFPAREPLSPFLGWAEDDELLPASGDAPDQALLVQLLQHPDAVVDRILDPQRVQATTTGSLAVTAACGGVAALVMLSGWKPLPWLLLDAGMVVLGLLGALTASLLPIYGASILHTVRLPLGRLVALLCAAVATAAIVLLAASVAPMVLWRLDPEWAGPLGIVGSFLLASAAGALRFRSLLGWLAERSGVEAEPARQPGPRLGDPRLRAFSRVAMLVLGFTHALAGWAWLAAS